MIYSKYDFSDTSLLKTVGKTKQSGTSLMLPWSYSGFEFNFTGTGFILSFEAFKDASPAYVKVTVDGVSGKYAVSDGKEVIVTECLEDKLHHASVIRVTEGLTALCAESIALTGKSPRIEARPDDKELKLMFIGDSITCGYGVLAPKDINVFNTYEEDCTRTYAYEAAKLLDAEIWFAGASGKGIVANCEGNRSDMTLRQAFTYETRQGGNWDHGKYTPDAVVVNAGTNDAWGGIGDEEYAETVKLFTEEIRTAHPNAKILWLYGIMDGTKIPCLKKAVEEMRQTDKDVFFMSVESVYHFPEETGGIGHPNTLTSARVAPLLAGKIKEILK